MKTLSSQLQAIAAVAAKAESLRVNETFWSALANEDFIRPVAGLAEYFQLTREHNLPITMIPSEQYRQDVRMWLKIQLDQTQCFCTLPRGRPFPGWTEAQGDRDAYRAMVNREEEEAGKLFYRGLAWQLEEVLDIDPREATLSGAFYIDAEGVMQRNGGHCVSVDAFMATIDRIVAYRQALMLLTPKKEAADAE